MINITKSPDTPPSLAIEKLKAFGKYNKADVLSQLQIDFKNKCYLCEDRSLTQINVEHFKPHKGNVDLKFDWKNLYYCCGHCNNIKRADPRFDNLLDCTNPVYDVLKKVKLIIDPFPYESVVVTPMDCEAETINTATLLDETYNGYRTTTKEQESHNLREKILAEIVIFQELLRTYFRPGNNQDDKVNIKASIRRMLSKEAPFTAFKAWIILRNTKLNAEFGTLIPQLGEPVI